MTRDKQDRLGRWFHMYFLFGSFLKLAPLGIPPQRNTASVRFAVVDGQ